LPSRGYGPRPARPEHGQPLLTGKTRFKLEIKTAGAGTSRNVALQLGAGWQWCEGSWGWINPGQTETVELDMGSLSCGIADLSRLQAVYVWFSAGGTFYLDAVRAE
jgi:mannan endo-1,4-beta-mannosidase